MNNDIAGNGTLQRTAFLIAATAVLVWLHLYSIAGAAEPAGKKYCSATAKYALASCRRGVQDDYFAAYAKCINESDLDQRTACVNEARAVLKEELQVCHDQRAARREVCAAVGEGRYDPPFDPAAFDTNFALNPNPYIPVNVGNRWEYEGGSESIAIEVLNQTKLIEGVTCIVVNDRVEDDGELVENTDDWFAKAKNGDIHYCGEEVKDYEHFEGDVPRREELVSIDGSFKVGRDGAKPGIVFRAAPKVGEVYRQEFLIGEAEDVVEVLSTNYAFGNNAELDELVPPALAARFCPSPPLSSSCVVTLDTTPLSPGGFERKYYAPGVGMFLETNPEDGEAVQLVNCNFDPRCVGLPTP